MNDAGTAASGRGLRGVKTAMRWLPAFAWMAFIFWLSSRPLPAPAGFEIPDKIVHLSVYAVLGALLWWAAAPLGRAPAARLAVTLSALYGASDEAHHHFVAGRSADIADWVADIAGATVAVIIIAAVTYRRSCAPGGTKQPPP